MSVDYGKIEAQYKSTGLLVEKIPYYRDDIKLQLFDAMTKEEIEKLKENMKHVNVWKVTADPDFKEDEAAADCPVYEACAWRHPPFRCLCEHPAEQ